MTKDEYIGNYLDKKLKDCKLPYGIKYLNLRDGHCDKAEKNWNNKIKNNMKNKKNDPVNNPSHYTDGKIEVIDFIEDKGLDFCLGNTVKYISRAGKKEPDKIIQDLEKAQWYLQRKINNLKKLQTTSSK